MLPGQRPSESGPTDHFTINQKVALNTQKKSIYISNVNRTSWSRRANARGCMEMYVVPKFSELLDVLLLVVSVKWAEITQVENRVLQLRH